MAQEDDLIEFHLMVDGEESSRSEYVKRIPVPGDLVVFAIDKKPCTFRVTQVVLRTTLTVYSPNRAANVWCAKEYEGRPRDKWE